MDRTEAGNSIRFLFNLLDRPNLDELLLPIDQVRNHPALSHKAHPHTQCQRNLPMSFGSSRTTKYIHTQQFSKAVLHLVHAKENWQCYNYFKHYWHDWLNRSMKSIDGKLNQHHTLQKTH